MHYPARTSDPLHPKPRPTNPEEAAFLGLGPGAERWLILAAASGAERVRTKIRRAAELAALVGPDQVDRALGLAAEAGRFADGDLRGAADATSEARIRLDGAQTTGLLRLASAALIVLVALGLIVYLLRRRRTLARNVD